MDACLRARVYRTAKSQRQAITQAEHAAEEKSLYTVTSHTK